MNLKRNGLIAAALVLLGVVVLLALIKMNNPDEMGSPKNTETKSETMYGALRMPFPDFRITSDIKSEDYPMVFEKDGLTGYKDKTGKIIVAPTYGMAQAFANGVGRVRIDNPDGSYTWKVVNIDGHVYDYDEVYGFFYGLALGLKDSKYGFINYDGQKIVPFAYDKVFNFYSDNVRSFYAIRDGKLVHLNLIDGYEEVFEKYDPNHQSQYQQIIDLKYHNLTIIDNRLMVNRQFDSEGEYFPLTILQDLDFVVYDQDRKVGTYKASLKPGDLEGEVFITFPDYQNGTENDPPTGYYAVLASADIVDRRAEVSESTEQYKDTVERYLRDNRIENTPVSIHSALRGDFQDNGVTGVVLEVNDNYREDQNSRPFKEGWGEEQFATNKSALVNAILIIDDLSKPSDYRVIKSNLWTHLDATQYITHNVEFIANLDADPPMELLISNGYYEYRDYSILDLI